MGQECALVLNPHKKLHWVCRMNAPYWPLFLELQCLYPQSPISKRKEHFQNLAGSSLERPDLTARCLLGLAHLVCEPGQEPEEGGGYHPHLFSPTCQVGSAWRK